MHQRAILSDANIIQEVFGGQSVGAVHRDGVVLNQPSRAADIDALDSCLHVNAVVESFHESSGNNGLAFSEIAAAEEGLAVEIRGFDDVVIDQGQMANARCCQLGNHGSSQPATAYDQDPGAGQAPLPDKSNFGQDQLAAVTVKNGHAADQHAIPDGERYDLRGFRASARRLLSLLQPLLLPGAVPMVCTNSQSKGSQQWRVNVAEVVVELGGKEILRIPLKGPTMTIGRDPQCDLHLDNRALSRRHAVIEKRGAAVWVRDLESQNGTFVNGTRIADPQALNGGDWIEVGRYQVRIDGVEAARQDTPVLTLTGPEGTHRFAMIGEEVILGRAPSCDIAIGHKSISRRHMRIAIEHDHFIAEDLGSQNGSRINNKRINGPTAFRLGDKIQMSEFTIEVGLLDEAEPNAGHDRLKPSKTMMIDRSELAKAAYVGGDFEKIGTNLGNISIGAQHQATGGKVQTGEGDPVSDEQSFDEEHTVGAPPISTPVAPAQPLRVPPLAQIPGGPGFRPPNPKPPAQGPILTVNHPDAPDRAVVLQGEVTVLGEDGADGDGTDGRSYSNQGYIIFIKGPRSVMAIVAGDRRLLTVNGKASLTAVLVEGDTLELGLLTVVFHHQG